MMERPWTAPRVTWRDEAIAAGTRAGHAVAHRALRSPPPRSQCCRVEIDVALGSQVTRCASSLTDSGADDTLTSLRDAGRARQLVKREEMMLMSKTNSAYRVIISSVAA
jgi:hypothetical protein